MSDITREDAVKWLTNLREDCGRYQDLWPYGEALEQIIKLLDTDVAPVVRCKDCRHAVDYYHEGDCYCSNPKCGLNYFGGSWEFYCADAERRNDETDRR